MRLLGCSVGQITPARRWRIAWGGGDERKLEDRRSLKYSSTHWAGAATSPKVTLEWLASM